MKKIKIFIVALLVITSFAFMPPKFNASEMTTEPMTTEEITEQESEATIDLEDSLEKIKTWIVGVSMSIISGGLLSTVAFIVLRDLKNKALANLNEAVAQHKMSQELADDATKVINDGVDLLESKFDKFEETVNKQISSMDNSVQDLVDGFNTNFLSKLNRALTEYFAEEEE